MHLVSVFFSTATYDTITRDERANFETKLSAVGGAMGLFTGFSLLSGVEICYFIIKFLVCAVQKHLGRIKKKGMNK